MSDEERFMIFNPLVWLMVLIGLGWMLCDYILHKMSMQPGLGFFSAFVDLDWEGGRDVR